MVPFSQIKDEVQLNEGECCIIFDFACYFPYSNVEVLTFDFSLGTIPFDDHKLNHRYPNHGYQTISKKYGRRISKLGYPYKMKLDEQGLMLLCLKVGIRDRCVELVFPLQTSMTKDRPISVLSLSYSFEKNEFHFSSPERVEEGCYRMHNWYSHPVEHRVNDDCDIILTSPIRPYESEYTVLYEDVITAYGIPFRN